LPLLSVKRDRLQALRLLFCEFSFVNACFVAPFIGDRFFFLQDLRYAGTELRQGLERPGSIACDA